MSKWKKIGSVHSGDDNKSNRSVRSRSRDQMPTQSFHQSINKMKMSSSELIDSQNTYFCKNYIDRKKQTQSNRSHSRIKTEKSVNTQKEDMMRSTISKKKISKDDDNESHYSSGDRLDSTHQPKKLKKNPKQGEIKELKEDHYRLREYVKFQINSFKAAFKDFSQELKYQIQYKKQAQVQKAKQSPKAATLVPLVPYRFDSKILDSVNFYDTSTKKQSVKPSQQADINVLHQIKTEARLCIDSLNQYEDQKADLLQKYKDLNLEQLLA